MATTDHLDLKLSSTDNQLLQQAAAIEGIFDPKRHDRSAFACGEPTLDALITAPRPSKHAQWH